MLSKSAFLLSLSLFVAPAFPAQYSTTATSTPHDNQADCTCYAINSGADSNTPTYFQYYRFYDFRNLADKPGQYTTAPPLVNGTFDGVAGDNVWNADILNSDAWNTDWGVQNWSKPATEDFPIRMANSPANIYLSQNDNASDPFTYLTLRTSRLDDFQSAGEIENEQKNLMHCSMRLYGRVVGDKGAVAGFFTFFDDNNESDIEVLTNDAKDTIRYTNQPAVDKHGDEVPSASIATSKLPKWDEWQTHRIDWLPKNSHWFLNGQQVATNTYSVPRKPSYLVLNMWSDGGTWSGNMTRGASAEFQIQWIEMAFNTSGPVGGPGGGRGGKRSLTEELWPRKERACKTVCKVDDVQTVGTPEVVFRGAASVVGASGYLGTVAALGVVAFQFLLWG